MSTGVMPHLAYICFYYSKRIFYNLKTRRKAKEEAPVFSLYPPLTEFSTGNLRERFLVFLLLLLFVLKVFSCQQIATQYNILAKAKSRSCSERGNVVCADKEMVRQINNQSARVFCSWKV